MHGVDNPRSVPGRSGYVGIPGYLDGVVKRHSTYCTWGGQSQECPGYVGIPDRGVAYIETLLVDNPRNVLGRSGYVGIPGYLDRGVAYSDTLTYTVHVHGGPSQECPGMVWLHGNPRILGQGG